MASTYIQIRTDEEDKKEASEILKALGTNLSAVLNMTIKQIILQKRIPFDVALPAETVPSKRTLDVAASMSMENMPLDQEGLQSLEEFSRKTPSEQEQEIEDLKNMYRLKEKQHA